MDPMDGLEALVRRAQSGDMRAVEHLFHQTVDDVHRIVLARTGDPFLAQDAVQEAYLQALTRLDQVRASTRFTAWVASIALNVYRNLAEERKRVIPLASVSDAYRREPRTRRPADLPHEQAASREAVARMQAIIDQLPPPFDEVFQLRYVAGCSYADIAELMDVPLGTAKSRVHRARQHFNELWFEEQRPTAASGS